MKKFLIVALGVALCVAFTAPAMAKVTVGGMITTDVYYHDQSGEWTNGGVVQGAVNRDNGRSELNINPNFALNRLIVRYASDDKVLSGYIEFRYGMADQGNNFDPKYMWMDYKINEMVHFRVGRQPGAFSVFTPTADALGYSDLYSLLVNYGNIQVTDADSVKLYWKFNDNVRLELQAEDPNQDAGEAPAGFAAEPGGVVREENDLPRFDIALPINFGNFKFEPAFTWLSQDYDQVAAGLEDSVDMWGLSLGASASFGPLTLSGEINYGQNLGDDSYGGAGGTPGWAGIIANGRAVDHDGDGINESIEDSDYLGAWIQLAYKFGIATFQVAVGMEQIENDGTARLGGNDDIDTERWGIGVSLPISVAKGFIVCPAITYYDNDDGASDGVNNPLTVDYGDITIVGVQFMLVF
jgi:hypothetical protein